MPGGGWRAGGRPQDRRPPRCGAAVTVVAPEVHVAVGALVEAVAIQAIEDTPLDIQMRPYEPGRPPGTGW